MSEYRIDKKGRRVQVTPPTQDHPEGNRPRRPDGTPYDAQPPRTDLAPDTPKDEE